MKRERIRVQVDCSGKGKTEQSKKNECDINNQVARAKKTGYLKQRIEQARYGDFATAADYFTCQQAIVQAEKDFMALPAEVRLRFNNSPGKLIDFLSDEQNRTEAEKLGLMIPKVAPTKEEAEGTVVPPAANNTPTK